MPEKEAILTVSSPLIGQSSEKKLGTFLGVFTPSILTILGVIMYLRLGWVLGNEGLIRTLIIVVLANSITLITALSVSAVATNMRVGVGGAYFIISRSLGLEIGGAIGLPLFLSQALSVTLYAFGLAESIRFVWPGAPLVPVAAGIVVLVTIISLVSASFALKVQLPVMVCILLSLFSLGLGAYFSVETPVVIEPSPLSPGFWVVFAIFFPAVTGILAGISMSGDLKNPKKSIPIGSVSAVLAGFVVYLSVPVILAFSATREDLLTDSLIWIKIAKHSWLIFPGLWGAILSSAVGSILSAPRTLQALAFDRIVPSALGRLWGGTGEPYIAVLFTSGIALMCVLMGDLNAVAPIVTMFFLTTYGMVNLVAGLESLVGDPSYRPQLKIPWYVCLLGALGCFWVMFLISKIAFFAALIVEFFIWLFLRRRALETTWGDLRRGFWMALTRFALIMLKGMPDKPRAWRPNILLFAGDVSKRIDLIRFATWFGQNKGIVTVCNLLEGDLDSQVIDVHKLQREMDEIIESRYFTVFSEVNVVDDFERGILTITQANGIAGLTSNTLMFGWSKQPERLAQKLRIMRLVAKLHKSMILCSINPRRYYDRTKQIVLWWGGQQNNGDIMLLLAHLLSLNSEWSNAKITIKSIARSPQEQNETIASLDRMIPEVRIHCVREVFLVTMDVSIKDFIHQESRMADVVFLGLAEPSVGNELEYANRLIDLVSGLGTTIFVKNSSLFSGRLIG